MATANGLRVWIHQVNQLPTPEKVRLPSNPTDSVANTWHFTIRTLPQHRSFPKRAEEETVFLYNAESLHGFTLGRRPADKFGVDLDLTAEWITQMLIAALIRQIHDYPQVAPAALYTKCALLTSSVIWVFEKLGIKKSIQNISYSDPDANNDVDLAWEEYCKENFQILGGIYKDISDRKWKRKHRSDPELVKRKFPPGFSFTRLPGFAESLPNEEDDELGNGEPVEYSLLTPFSRSVAPKQGAAGRRVERKTRKPLYINELLGTGRIKRWAASLKKEMMLNPSPESPSLTSVPSPKPEGSWTDLLNSEEVSPATEAFTSPTELTGSGAPIPQITSKQWLSIIEYIVNRWKAVIAMSEELVLLRSTPKVGPGAPKPKPKKRRSAPRTKLPDVPEEINDAPNPKSNVVMGPPPPGPIVRKAKPANLSTAGQGTPAAEDSKAKGLVGPTAPGPKVKVPEPRILPATQEKIMARNPEPKPKHMQKIPLPAPANPVPTSYSTERCSSDIPPTKPKPRSQAGVKWADRVTQSVPPRPRQTSMPIFKFEKELIIKISPQESMMTGNFSRPIPTKPEILYHLEDPSEEVVESEPEPDTTFKTVHELKSIVLQQQAQQTPYTIEAPGTQPMIITPERVTSLLRSGAATRPLLPRPLLPKPESSRTAIDAVRANASSMTPEKVQFLLGVTANKKSIAPKPAPINYWMPKMPELPAGFDEDPIPPPSPRPSARPYLKRKESWSESGNSAMGQTEGSSSASSGTIGAASQSKPKIKIKLKLKPKPKPGETTMTTTTGASVPASEMDTAETTGQEEISSAQEGTRTDEFTETETNGTKLQWVEPKTPKSFE